MGELAGTRQAGGFHLRFADLETDGDLVVAARRTALELIARDPDLSGKEQARLRSRIERRYERGMELFRVG
jgi:RecG-like helicase